MQEKKYIYCWSCKTSQLMNSVKPDIEKNATLFKCPNCGFINIEVINEN